MKIGRLGLGILMTIALLGCIQNQATPLTIDNPNSTTEATIPVRGTSTEQDDTLIICMTQEPDTLFPPASRLGVTAQVLAAAHGRGVIPDRGFFYETQMLVDDEFPTLKNGGAVLKDQGDEKSLTVTFHFKDNITWSDGEPFTVDDLLFTFDILTDPQAGFIAPDSAAAEVEYRKIDEHTLQVIYPPGIQDPLYFLPGLANWPLPKHILGSMPATEILNSDYIRLPNPVLGPYEFVEWKAADHIELKAVKNWWGGDQQFEHVIYRFIADTNQLLAQVLSHECDFATPDAFQLSQLPFIQQAAGEGLISYQAIPGTLWEHIDMNTAPVPGAEREGIPFFADTRVRQAVAYGTNRQEMVDDVLQDEVTVLNSYLPESHWAWSSETKGLYSYDPQRAKELLAEAGWEDANNDGILEAQTTLTGEYSCDRGTWTIPAGTPFEVDFHTSTGNAMRDALSAIFQSNMADIGIKVNLAPIPGTLILAEDGPFLQRRFQIGEFAWLAGADPNAFGLYAGINVYRTPTGEILTADELWQQDKKTLAENGLDYEELAFGRPGSQLPEGYLLAAPEEIPGPENPVEGSNVTGWCDPEATLLLYQGANHIEAGDRLEYFLAFQKIFIEQVPVIPLFQRVDIYVFASNLCGMALGPTNSQEAAWNVEKWHFAAPGDSCPEP